MQTATTIAPNAHASDSKFAIALATWRRRRDHQEAMPLNGCQEAEDDAWAATAYAEDVLVRTPAQTLSDLRAKAEIIWCDAGSVPSDEYVAAFFADLCNLTGNEQSRTFDAAGWLSWFERIGGGWVEREGDIILMAPDQDQLKDAFWMLNTRGGREAVKAVIRERIASQEAA